MEIKRYLLDDADLVRGSVDDLGDSQYARLSQNVPDGYVTDLQTDLGSLGFEEVGEPDGAFGKDTRAAVKAFQQLAGIEKSGVVDRRTRDEIKLWLERGHDRNHLPGRETTHPASEGAGFQTITPRVPHFSQGDPRWAKRVLGRDSTIRRSGCAISCIAMILRFHGRNVDPGVLDAYLDANDGYQDDSVKWNVAGKCSEEGAPSLTYARWEGSEQELHAELCRRIDQSRPTMVRVDYRIDPDIRYNHFVLGVGRSPDGGILMNDPATRSGDGYANPVDDNVIQKTGRKSGYEIVQLDWYDPES
jgi:hypothetical protein